MALIKLSHFYRGKLFKDSLSQSDFIITACSEDLNPTESRAIFDSVWTVRKTFIDYSQLKEGLALILLNDNSFLLISILPGEYRERGHVYPHYHCWVISRELITSINFDYLRLLEISAYEPRRFEQEKANFNLPLQPFELSEKQSFDSRQQLQKLLANFKNYNITPEIISRMISSIILNFPNSSSNIAILNAPDSLEERLEFIRLISILLPDKVKVDVTFATEVFDAATCRASVQFLYQYNLSSTEISAPLVYYWGGDFSDFNKSVHPYSLLLFHYFEKKHLEEIFVLAESVNELVNKIHREFSERLDYTHILSIASWILLAVNGLLNKESVEWEELRFILWGGNFLDKDSVKYFLRNIVREFWAGNEIQLAEIISQYFGKEDVDYALRKYIYDEITETNIKPLEQAYVLDLIFVKHNVNTRLFKNVIRKYCDIFLDAANGVIDHESYKLVAQTPETLFMKFFKIFSKPPIPHAAIDLNNRVSLFLGHVSQSNVFLNKYIYVFDEFSIWILLARVFPSAAGWFLNYVLLSLLYKSEEEISRIVSDSGLLRNITDLHELNEHLYYQHLDEFELRRAIILALFKNDANSFDSIIKTIDSLKRGRITSVIDSTFRYFFDSKLTSSVCCIIVCLLRARLIKQNRIEDSNYFVDDYIFEAVFSNSDKELALRLARFVAQQFRGNEKIIPFTTIPNLIKTYCFGDNLESAFEALKQSILDNNLAMQTVIAKNIVFENLLPEQGQQIRSFVDSFPIEIKTIIIDKLNEHLNKEETS